LDNLRRPPFIHAQSRARYYLRDPPQQYAGLPTVHSLPAEWMNETR
jgi:hypothetical protein